MHELVALLYASEEALMARILNLALAFGYTRYTSSKMEDWRLSIHGLIEALEAGLAQGGIPESTADEDFSADPVTAFGVDSARRHRERGVSLPMYQGLYKYYRRAFREELQERAPGRDDWQRILSLFFDRLELAFCASWGESGVDANFRELQAANRILANSKNMFMTMAESLAQPVIVLDLAQGVRYANPAYSHLQRELGGPQEVSAASLLEFIPWLEHALRQQRESGQHIRLQGQSLTVGDGLRYFNASLTTMADMSGVFTGSVVLLEEVTAERNARRAYERGRAERISMLDAMPVAVVITGVADGIIQYVNGMAADMVGLTHDAMVGRYAPDLYVNPAERVRMVELLQRQGFLLAHEVRLKRGDTPLPCLMSAVPVVHFEKPCYLFTLLDISARKRIEEEVAKLSQALQQSPIAVFITDRDGRIEYVNNAFENLTGYSQAEIQGQTPKKLKSIRHDAVFFDKMWKSLLAGHPWRGEMSNRHKNGGEYWVMAHIAPLFGREEESMYFVSFMEDITKRKLAESVLQERLQFIQTLMDAVPTPIFYKNVEGVYQGCNRAFEEYFGILRPHLIGKTALDISSDKMSSIYHEKDIQLARRGGIQIYESHTRRKDGEMRDVIFHKATYRDSKGQPAGIVGSVTDITERKRSEREAMENAATLRHALSGIRAGILVVDPELEIIEDVNERALELLGGEHGDYLGKPCAAIGWQDEFGREVAIGRILQPQSDREFRLLRPGRSVLPVALTVLPSTIKGNSRILLILFDLTERKTLERQLNLAQKLESVGQLAAGIAHEINTPIQYVSSNLTFLAEAMERLQQELDGTGCTLTPQLRGDFGEVPEAIKDAQEGVQRVASIVQAMRNFSHPGYEEQISVDVNEAIRNTVIIARNEWKYASEVVLELDDALPSVLCVPGDFNQAVLNVLVNAAHAVADKVGESGEKGEIRISTAKHGNFAEISISDTGGGIPEDNRDKIFDPFFTTKVVGKGTGQGLAITHAIVERHHGEISFQSEVGKGTTFLMRFPLDGLVKETIQ